MFARSIRLCLISALLMGAGAHVVVMQFYAWTCMAVSNMRGSDLRGAIDRTFDGRHPCRLCLKLKKARRSKSGGALRLPQTRVDILFEAAPLALTDFVSSWRVAAFSRGKPSVAKPIDIPPPRSLQA